MMLLVSHDADACADGITQPKSHVESPLIILMFHILSGATDDSVGMMWHWH